ncbi:hypothetical protein MASSI9I_90159 [Massilia sp. 9I]|nr:hypothetical protein MASSI9I_90159 [Massilia sp. 9I]
MESVFFAFVKFIMCLLVPEVKAVSCVQVMHMQVLESNKKNAISSGFRGPFETCSGTAFDVVLKRSIRAASGCLNINRCDPIVHDMLKLWRTRTVNTAWPESDHFAYGARPWRACVTLVGHVPSTLVQRRRTSC